MSRFETNTLFLEIALKPSNYQALTVESVWTLLFVVYVYTVYVQAVYRIFIGNARYLYLVRLHLSSRYYQTIWNIGITLRNNHIIWDIIFFQWFFSFISTYYTIIMILLYLCRNSWNYCTVLVLYNCGWCPSFDLSAWGAYTFQ